MCYIVAGIYRDLHIYVMVLVLFSCTLMYSKYVPNKPNVADFDLFQFKLSWILLTRVTRIKINLIQIDEG